VANNLLLFFFSVEKKKQAFHGSTTGEKRDPFDLYTFYFLTKDTQREEKKEKGK